ncbi:BglG family transcription antiterminator [Enterococcus camelliae]|uniref:BglG family transcription antiterminator n=1 Tax=Enterococcus camelliae TaxID=453959 RepID=A0ABW5TI29_9ENTE
MNNAPQRLLEILSKAESYLTSKDLSEKLLVSKKTVYRLITRINEQTYPDLMIISERGKGYRVDYDLFIKNFIHNHNLNINYSPLGRRNYTLIQLLIQSPKTISEQELFGRFFVSDSVIYNDEQFIEKWLNSYDIKLVRREKKIGINGEEEDIRRALLDLYDKYKIIDLNDINSICGEFNQFDVNFSLELIDKMESKLGFLISYPYNINLFTHICILIERIRNNQIIDEGVVHSHEIEKLIVENEEIFQVANLFVYSIKKYVNKNLPEEEAYYLFQYLLSSRISFQNKKNQQQFTDDVKLITQRFIQLFFDNKPQKNVDQSLYGNLLRHVKPMLNRLKNNFKVKNNLLIDIEGEYPSIFLKLKEVSKKIEFEYNLSSISDDEVGFMTLYFAEYLEKYSAKISILIVCTTGVGTSELLKVKIQKIFPELDIVDVVASTNVKEKLKNFSKKIDLVISTVNIFTDNFMPKVLLVSSVFNEKDQERLRNSLRSLQNENTRSTKEK